MNKWDERFIEMAHTIATWSKDPRTVVGSIIVKDRRVISQGYNGLPMGVPDCTQYLEDRILKNKVIIHSEINALLNAARNGSTTFAATIYITWPPCSHCAGAIVQAGIWRVVCPYIRTVNDAKWRENFYLGEEILRHGDVEISNYEITENMPSLLVENNPI